MREQLNDNPLVQMAVIGVLLVAVGIFVFTSMGGGGESESSAPSPTSVTATVNGATATGSTPGEAVENAVESLPAGAVAATTGAASAVPPATRPIPKPLLAAWNANRTVVLLVVHDGGIDDDLVKLAATSLHGLAGVSYFVVPAARIARYAAITQGIGVNRVPALVVLRPKRLGGPVPTGTVSYGFQDAESIVQAVRDAGYRGPTVEYHP